jgi:demethylmenaquinone methyltransferase/2-methoxy-6-polyprenyl-1,4-benzoquinol methylase
VFLTMPQDELEELLNEQMAYYRARAAEYDATTAVDDASRVALLDALEEFAPWGQVLELACGTGQWTAELARHASRVTAVDASPEMIAVNRARVAKSSVHYVEADLFSWSPTERYDVVFFSAWLSHVPPQRFEDFWALVAGCLNQRGRVFFIDELPAVAAHERLITTGPAPAVERPLRTGARYRAVKVLHEPGELGRQLADLGWQVTIRAVGWRFFYAMGAPV